MNLKSLADTAYHRADLKYSASSSELHRRITSFASSLTSWRGFNQHDAFRESAKMRLADVAIEALTMLRGMGNSQWDMREGLSRGLTIFADPEKLVAPLRVYADGSQRVDPLINLELLVVTCHELAQRLFQETVHDLVTARLEAK